MYTPTCLEAYKSVNEPLLYTGGLDFRTHERLISVELAYSYPILKHLMKEVAVLKNLALGVKIEQN